MNQDVCVSSDGRGEMCVERSSKAIMVKLSCIEISTAKVGGLVHASGCHDPDELVEEFVIYSLHKVQTVG